jgi:hypothetical protein
MVDYNFPRVLQPKEATALHTASLKAIAALGGREKLGVDGREQLVAAMMWVARSGYARAADDSLDPELLAEAAILRYRATQP